jgi:hypothetical protein
MRLYEIKKIEKIAETENSFLYDLDRNFVAKQGRLKDNFTNEAKF